MSKVNLQGRRHIVAATRAACWTMLTNDFRPILLVILILVIFGQSCDVLVQTFKTEKHSKDCKLSLNQPIPQNLYSFSYLDVVVSGMQL